jgi:EAL domain-containing protein (putative c-di-GMP-specific phosphodiesterase class I)
VLQDACQQARRWRRDLKADIRVCVNLSAAHLRATSIVKDVRSALQDASIDGSALILEVTEGALIADVSEATAVLESLRSFGISISFDDFGTGYSSLSHLQSFPVDIIKVDKSFVDGVCRGTDDAMLVRSVLAIGREFGLQVVAEGIESEDQDVELRRLGCSYGQGFLYARPVDAATIDELLSTGDLACHAAGPDVEGLSVGSHPAGWVTA